MPTTLTVVQSGAGSLLGDGLVCNCDDEEADATDKGNMLQGLHNVLDNQGNTNTPVTQ